MVSPIDNVDLITGSALSVGFQSIEQIKPLGDLLRIIFKDSFFKAETALEDIHKNMEKNASNNDKLKQKELSILEKIHEKNVESVEKLHNLSRENDKRIETWIAFAKTSANVLTKALTNHVKHSVELANTFRDIESSGVYVKEGFNYLSDVAKSTGMAYDELAGHLKANAPLFAKLNNSLGDGVKIFKKSMESISKEYNLTRSEEVAAFASVVENLTPVQLKEMEANGQLSKRVDEAARQMKLLSLATGKTVEQIKEEQELKAKSLRVDAWKRNNQQQAQMLGQLGLDSDQMIDYLLSGGSRITPEIAMQIAGDQFAQVTLPEVMRMLQSGTLNMENVAGLQSRYGGLAEARMREVQANAQNQQMFAVGSASGLGEQLLYNDSIARRFSELNFNNVIESQNNKTEGRKDSEKMLSSQRELTDSMNNLANQMKDLQTGGVKGMTFTFEQAQNLYSIAGDTVGVLNSIVDKLGPMSGIVGSIIAGAIPGVASYLGSRAGSGAVKMLKTGKDKIRGKSKGKSKGKGISKAINKISKNASKGISKASKGFGKIAGSLGKKIPGVGLMLGAGYALNRFANGEFLKGGAELLSGVLSTVPGLGTLASTAIDGALMASDIMGGESTSKIPSSSTIGDSSIDIVSDNTSSSTRNISDEILKTLKNIEKHTCSIDNTSYQTRLDTKLTPVNQTPVNYTSSY